MSDTQKTLLGPDNYRELCEPFKSIDDANKAIDGFWEELYELRNKYRIPDVHVIVRFTVLTQSDKEQECITAMHAGSSMFEEMMSAWALGQAQARRQESVSEVMTQAIQAGKTKL